MKSLPAGLQAHLDGGATTLCWCWKLVRSDGVVLGFTDHDRDLDVEGVAYQAASGFTASEAKSSLGLSVDDLEVDGALSSDSLTEADLLAGLWDNAAIELRRVNWADPVQAVIMRTGNVGEVRRGSLAFTAELRGMAHELGQEIGRIFSYSCDANLGDDRCRVALSEARFHGAGNVSATLAADRWFAVEGLGDFDAGWFNNGALTWTSGENAGRAIEVRSHSVVAGVARLELWMAMGSTVTAGDTFSIRVGCDKQFRTCRDRFGNLLNFRGFPYMPSNMLVASYPNDHTANDGGSLYGN